MKILISFAMLSLVITITGCGGGGGGEGDDGTGASTSGGEVPAEYAGPIAETADATAGAESYDQACASCHPGDAPDLAGIAWSAGAVRQQVREGSDEMPPFNASRISDDDLENILAHMATMGAVN
jgi:mono/diheme cytochrome c family protein